VALTNHIGSLQAEVEREIGSIVPQQQREQVIARVTAIMRREEFRGPIAHPDHLDRYEKICPGAADRIISMAEREQQFRIDVLTKSQDDDTLDRKRGMYCGLAAFLALVSGGVVCAFWGHLYLGAAFVAVGALSAAAVFVHGRQSPEADPKKKQ
jgi:uncharacterized membrane protein